VNQVGGKWAVHNLQMVQLRVGGVLIRALGALLVCTFYHLGAVGGLLAVMVGGAVVSSCRVLCGKLCGKWQEGAPEPFAGKPLWLAGRRNIIVHPPGCGKGGNCAPPAPFGHLLAGNEGAGQMARVSFLQGAERDNGRGTFYSLGHKKKRARGTLAQARSKLVHLGR
jgi:hypothetical protein